MDRMQPTGGNPGGARRPAPGTLVLASGSRRGARVAPRRRRGWPSGWQRQRSHRRAAKVEARGARPLALARNTQRCLRPPVVEVCVTGTVAALARATLALPDRPAGLTAPPVECRQQGPHAQRSDDAPQPRLMGCWCTVPDGSCLAARACSGLTSKLGLRLPAVVTQQWQRQIHSALPLPSPNPPTQS